MNLNMQCFEVTGVDSFACQKLLRTSTSLCWICVTSFFLNNHVAKLATRRYGTDDNRSHCMCIARKYVLGMLLSNDARAYVQLQMFWRSLICAAVCMVWGWPHMRFCLPDMYDSCNPWGKTNPPISMHVHGTMDIHGIHWSMNYMTRGTSQNQRQ